jgi:hypothetical protein
LSPSFIIHHSSFIIIFCVVVFRAKNLAQGGSLAPVCNEQIIGEAIEAIAERGKQKAMKAATQLSKSLKSLLPRSRRNRHLSDSLNCLPWPAAQSLALTACQSSESQRRMTSTAQP